MKPQSRPPKPLVSTQRLLANFVHFWPKCTRTRGHFLWFRVEVRTSRVWQGLWSLWGPQWAKRLQKSTKGENPQQTANWNLDCLGSPESLGPLRKTSGDLPTMAFYMYQGQGQSPYCSFPIYQLVLQIGQLITNYTRIHLITSKFWVCQNSSNSDAIHLVENAIFYMHQCHNQSPL